MTRQERNRLYAKELMAIRRERNEFMESYDYDKRIPLVAQKDKEYQLKIESILRGDYDDLKRV